MSAHPVYRFAGWTYDAGQRTLRSPTGEPVSLTPREHTLLRVFLDHPQEELDRRLLVEALYGPLSPVVRPDTALNTQICRLRDKLAGGNPMILGVVGGYWFCPLPEIVAAGTP